LGRVRSGATLPPGWSCHGASYLAPDREAVVDLWAGGFEEST
jgi:hypothetical protein